MKTYFLTLVLLGLSVCGFGQSTIGINSIPQVGHVYRICGLVETEIKNERVLTRNYIQYDSKKDSTLSFTSSPTNKNTKDLFILRKKYDKALSRYIYYFETYEKDGFIGRNPDKNSNNGYNPGTTKSLANVFKILSFEFGQVTALDGNTYNGCAIEFQKIDDTKKEGNRAVLTSPIPSYDKATDSYKYSYFNRYSVRASRDVTPLLI